ncbi:MAG: recombinase family protein [Oscillospiraceae bacterium]|nr:recombinase family protein [Oscillospiraceae bacterium]
MKKKKVFCLYRVSTQKQVDKKAAENDIPMQSQACHEFIASHTDWELYRELAEQGISGFKVRAENRDVIQEIQQEALNKTFDVLLVFMFDRLGRIDDETPFVVEWFVKQGIEVWSVTEGEQKIETHVDKLMNYIRYWQASGESIKTSIRTKTRLGQIVEAGCFRGGIAPYGYRLAKQGRLNKRNHEVFEILVDDEEAAVVRSIFDLYVTKGFGTQRISTTLTERGILNRKGMNFTNGTIRNMILNRAYLGVLKSGETESEIFPHLQIVDPLTFEAAQKLLKQRSVSYEERRVPLNTKGRSLLSGNVFCGHCGARLTVTTNGKKYIKKDGEATITPRMRYVCYNKTRHAHLCDGQTGYTVRKLDGVIDKIVHGLFERLNDVPKEAIIAAKCADQIAECQMSLAKAKAALQANTAEVMEYEAEVLKIIRGESKLNSELLNKLYEEAKRKAEESAELVHRLEDRLNSSEKMKATLSEQFDTLSGWAELYDTCDLAAKKMIVARLMKSVKVKRDYEVEIELSVDCEALGLSVDMCDVQEITDKAG